MLPDFYRILGVDPKADADAIRRAYRMMALKHHPDRNPKDRAAAEKRMQAINEAYGILKDKASREAYDRDREAESSSWGATSSPPPPPPPKSPPVEDEDMRPPSPSSNPSSINFGSVIFGQRENRRIVVTNSGGTPKDISINWADHCPCLDVTVTPATSTDPFPLTLQVRLHIPDAYAVGVSSTNLIVDLDGATISIPVTFEVKEPYTSRSKPYAYSSPGGSSATYTTSAAHRSALSNAAVKWVAAICIVGVVLFALSRYFSHSGTPQANTATSAAEQQINGMLWGWTGCHISNDAACETTFYAPKVDLYFVHRNVSRAYVLKLLKAALDKGGHLNQYHLENVRIQVLSPSSATVSLEKVWTSVSGADKIHHTQSQLGVVSINGTWLITSEKDISDRVETVPNNQAGGPNPADEPTEGAPLTPDSQTSSGNQPQPTDSQASPVNQTQNTARPPDAIPEAHGEPVLDHPVEIAGTLVRIDSRAGQMFYNVTNTSPVPFPRVTRMHFYSDSGRTGTPGGLVAQIPPLEPGQSGQIRLSISYTPQENFAFAGEAFGRTQPNQIFCSALASRFVGYAGVVLETNNFRIKMRFPCQ